MDLFAVLTTKTGWVGAALALASVAASAQSERHRTVIDYDAQGRVSEVRVESTGPGRVDALEPRQIRRGTSFVFVASGVNLGGVKVQADAGLSISQIVAQPQRVSFRLTAAPELALTRYPIRFLANGATPVSFDVDVVAPNVALIIDPPTLLIGNTPVQVPLRLSAAYDRPVLVVLRTEPAGVVSATPARVTIPAGQLQSSPVLLTPITLGSTQLFADADAVEDAQATVLTNSGFEPGISVFVAMRQPVSARVGPAETAKMFVASARPVQARAGPPAAPQTYVATQRLARASVGPWFHLVTPRQLTRGATTTLQIRGGGLAGVNAVELVPNDGVVVGTVTASTGQVTAVVTIAAGASPALRRVQLRAGTVAIPEHAGNDALVELIDP
jgi:hypothetical protein